MASSVASGLQETSFARKKNRSKSMSCSTEGTGRTDLNASIGSANDLENDSAFVGRKTSLPGFRESISGGSGMTRRGTFKGFAQSITSLMRLRRLTIGKISLTDSVKKKPTKEENTYKIGPEKGEIFIPDKVRSVAMDVIESEMKNVKYDAKLCGTKCCTLASKIKSAVKDLNYKRYRIVCQVVIGELKQQGTEAASRCVWDEKRDNFTYVNYRNDTLFANAMIYGIYLE